MQTAATTQLPASSPEFVIPPERPLVLESGYVLEHATIAYMTYGTLNADKSNAILICHALTGDQYVTGENKLGKPGWWSKLVGPGLAIDTNRYFVIGSNVLGGCMGTTGPGSINPATGKVYGFDFPKVTMGDMVGAQARLVEHLGIDKLLAVVGGSAGGMQVLAWAHKFPDRFHAAIPMCTAAQESPRNIALHEVSRQAIMRDPTWANGRYADNGVVPAIGLSVARMSAHINYLSPEKILKRFGRERHDDAVSGASYKADFAIESYLHHQGASFVERFDANTYIYLTKAIDLFDMTGDDPAGLANVFRGAEARFCVISFSSDWLQPPEESRKIVRALNANSADVTYAEIVTDNGHDAFLLEEPALFDVVSNFLAATADAVKAAPVEAQAPSHAVPALADRPDLTAIAGIIKPGSKVLDVGCGDGTLLALLRDHLGVKASGIELSQQGVNACVRKGLSVVQGDADRHLEGYIGGVFDYVILSHTILSVNDPRHVLGQLVQIGREAIVSIYNAAFWRDRLGFALKGRTPDSAPARASWEDSRTVRPCSLQEFRDQCAALNLDIRQTLVLAEDGHVMRNAALPDFFGRQAIFVLARK